MTTTMYPTKPDVIDFDLDLDLDRDGSTAEARPSAAQRVGPGTIGAVLVRSSSTAADAVYPGLDGGTVKRPPRKASEAKVSASVPVNHRIATRRAQVAEALASAKRRRRFFGLATVVAATAAVLVAFSPLMSVSSIEVTGTTDTSRIRELSGLSSGMPMVRVSSSSIRSRLIALPDIADATVNKRWFRAVSVNVVEEKPIAVIVGPTNTAVVGANGQVIKILASRPGPGTTALPRIEGIAPPGLGREFLGDASTLVRTAGLIGPLGRQRTDSIQMVNGKITLRVLRTGASEDPTSSRAEKDLLEVTLGTSTDLDLKTRALETMLGSTTLSDYDAVDFGVPDAPILRKAPSRVAATSQNR